jgi:hypothetical protein
MARGGHGLPKVSLGPAMPYPSTSRGRATPGAGQGGLWPSSTPLDIQRHTPMFHHSSSCELRFQFPDLKNEFFSSCPSFRCWLTSTQKARIIGVWQGVAMNSLKFYPSPPCPTLLHPAGPRAFSGVAFPQGGWLSAMFYPFGHPTPYAYYTQSQYTGVC